jgi:hypothetical protein
MTISLAGEHYSAPAKSAHHQNAALSPQNAWSAL